MGWAARARGTKTERIKQAVEKRLKLLSSTRIEHESPNMLIMSGRGVDETAAAALAAKAEGKDIGRTKRGD